MLRDRFRLWNAEPKYNRHQPVQPRRPKRKARPLTGNHAVEFTVSVNLELRMQQEAPARSAEGETATIQPEDEDRGIDFELPIIRRPSAPSEASFGLGQDSISISLWNPLAPPKLGRTPDTPQEDWHLQMTLKEVAGYLDRIVEEGTWAQRNEEPTFELQKLAANAHMAISSQSYDCHHIWRELGLLYSPVCHVMPKFDENNLLTMHPRALIVLLRLLVDSLSTGLWGSQTLEQVRGMFWFVTSQTLRAAHPLRLLCGMPKRKATELLFRLLELMDVRLFSRVSDQQPDGAVFVAQEQTYAARVLASLGYTQWAEIKLQSVIDDLDTHSDVFTQADAFRTLGYAREQSCAGIVSERTKPTLEESKTASASALALFVEMGKGCSNEAMFTHISLAQVSRKLGKLEEAQTHLAEAINVWQKTRKAENQGGSKLILDLHQVLVDQRKFKDARELRDQHQSYFEESRVYYE